MTLTDKERKKCETLIRMSYGKPLAWLFEVAPSGFHDDDDLARLAVEKNSNVFGSCSDRLRDDIDLARRAVEKSPGNFTKCSQRLRDDAAFATWAVEKCEWNFEYCSDRLRDEIDFVRPAIEERPANFRHVSDRLQADPLMQAYKNLVEAEENNEQPDLSAFTKPIRDAWQHTQLFHSTGNTAEAREYFAMFAKGTMAAEARREQGIAAEPLKPAQDISDQLDMGAFDLSR